MMTFLKLLFFSKVILLTPVPVDLHVGANTIPLPEPIEAISPGASVEIDVTSLVNPGMERDLIKDLLTLDDKIKKLFSGETIVALLVSEEGERAELIHHGGYTIGKTDVRISLLNKDGMPVDVEFIFLQINTTLPMKDVRIYWKNHVH